MATGERVAQAIAERIIAAMEQAGLKRQQLANRAGISRETMARKLDRAPETFTISELARLSDALQLPFEQLAFGTEVLA